MSLFNIDGIIEDLKNGAIEAAKSVAVTMLEEAAKDAVEFVGSAKDSIGRYIELVITGQITTEEFKSLMWGLLDLAEMNALTLGGMAEIEVDKTRNAILKVLTSIGLDAIGKIIP